MTEEAFEICPARISGIHTGFRRPLIDVRTGTAPALLFFQNSQDCMLCDLSSVQHEFEPLDVERA